MAPSRVALVRAVNLGGGTVVGMEALRHMGEAMGLQDVRTVLRSGNLVFREERSSSLDLERRLAAEATHALGIRTEFFVRTREEWHSICERNPFPEAASSDPSHLVVTVLKQAPSTRSWESLRAAIPGREQVEGGGREAYLVYPDGIGRSRLTARLIERHLGTIGTSRNWNTVSRLDALLSPG